MLAWLKLQRGLVALDRGRLDEALALYMRTLIDGLVAQSEEQTPILLKARDNVWSRFKAGIAYFLVNSVDYSIGRRIKFSLLRNR